MKFYRTILKKTTAIFICVMLSLFGTAQKTSLALQMLHYCEWITADTPAKAPIVNAAFNFYDAALKKDSLETAINSSRVAGFVPDSFYAVGTLEEHFVINTHIKNNNYYFKLAHRLHSTYSIIKSKVVYENKDYKYNISYPEMQYYFGKIFSDPFPQPKETKYYYFIYTNPKTKRKAKIEVSSWDGPQSKLNINYDGYNTIYSYRITNIELAL
jgi:hypothetical protein